MNRREEIRIHDLVELLFTLVFNWAHGDDARIVDQDIDAPELARGIW